MESEAAGVGYAATVAHRPVHGLDDVGADVEVAQRLFRAGPQRPDRRSLPAGKAQPFELAGTADQQAAHFGIVATTRTQLDHAGHLVYHELQTEIEARPAIGIHFTLQGATDLLLGARASDPHDAPLRHSPPA